METRLDKIHLVGAQEQFDWATNAMVEASRAINISDGKRAAFSWVDVFAKWIASGGVFANFAPTIQAAPLPNITVQAPPAAAPPIINVYVGGKKARIERR